MSSAGLRVGIVVTTPRCDGILRFLGSTEFGQGEWAGVELAVKEGKTDGRYEIPHACVYMPVCT
jgi:dynactin complex subunit